MKSKAASGLKTQEQKGEVVGVEGSRFLRPPTGSCVGCSVWAGVEKTACRGGCDSATHPTDTRRLSGMPYVILSSKEYSRLPESRPWPISRPLVSPDTSPGAPVRRVETDIPGQPRFSPQWIGADI